MPTVRTAAVRRAVRVADQAEPVSGVPRLLLTGLHDSRRKVGEVEKQKERRRLNGSCWDRRLPAGILKAWLG